MRRGLIGINIPKGVHVLFEDINPHLVRFLSIVKWAQGLGLFFLYFKKK